MSEQEYGKKDTNSYGERQCVIRIYGIVQGVGFRPFVSRIANALGVLGSVANKGSYVEVYAVGECAAMDTFLRQLEQDAPERSAILKMEVKETAELSYDTFEIIESEKEEGAIFVSPDIATCPKCKNELYDPKNRRYMHPFINCTACGPRVTILDSMPYDRVRTSMGEFPMCPECEYEYTHEETRRYDAQPVCCNDCGPEVYLADSPNVRGREAITRTRQAILDGEIVAIKGIGGFHLCCDATNEEAVARLRKLKHRPAKPFAVMMRDLDAVRRNCEVPERMEEILDGHQKPIILLKKKADPQIAPSVAPDNPKIGVMLPYAPVQMLLFDYNDGLTMTTDCFVMTSGNVSGAPICRTDEDALKEIAGFCDLILSHNRKIRLRADDSVMDFYDGKPYMIRRSRGYAPLPVMLEGMKGQVLAIGGELKNTFCIAKDSLFYPSPYVGDMEDLRTVEALRESIVRMEELLETRPKIVACDLHPRYHTTMVAEEQNLPVLKIQHHYAHVLSCMAENEVMPGEKVIGVSFDGTGYGLDETIWGGEILLSDYAGFERTAKIKPFLQIGGDASSKEGWRIAVSMINHLFTQEEAERLAQELDLCQPQMQKVMFNMGKRGINSIRSTSAGRLFDAVSAILGIRKVNSFEGEASTSLMFAAQRWAEGEGMTGKPDMPELKLIQKEEIWTMQTGSLVCEIIKQKMEGKSSDFLAWWFHKKLSEMIVEAVKKTREESGISSCALTGGVFQNILLLELCEKALVKEGFRVYRHSLIPPNDGGIALGQAAAAMYRLMNQSE